MPPNPPPLGQPQINIVQKNNSGCRTLLFVCLGIILAVTFVIGGCVVLGVWTIGETVDQVVESVKETEAEAKASPITAITWDAVTNARSPDNTLTELQQAELRQNVLGKRVRWSGTLVEVTSGSHVALHVSMDGDSKTDVVIRLLADQKKSAAEIAKGEAVTFEGTIDELGSEFLHARLKYGQISPRP